MPLNYTIFEDGNGGQRSFNKVDYDQTRSLATLVYLAMFSGNVDASTVRGNPDADLKSDWWGNDSEKESSSWVNSETERTLRGIDLSLRSREKIRQSVANDTKKLLQYGDIEVSVTLPAVNKVDIEVIITEPGKLNSTRLLVIWDATKNEIIEKRIL